MIEVPINQIVMLTREDVKKLTGWGEKTVQKLFTNEPDFPRLQFGQRELVSNIAFLEWTKARRSETFNEDRKTDRKRNKEILKRK